MAFSVLVVDSNFGTTVIVFTAATIVICLGTSGSDYSLVLPVEVNTLTILLPTV